MCRDLGVVVGFFNMKITNLLSHNRVGGASNFTPNSLNKKQYQCNLDDTSADTLNSASALEFHIAGCFFANHDNMVPSIPYT